MSGEWTEVARRLATITTLDEPDGRRRLIRELERRLDGNFGLRTDNGTVPDVWTITEALCNAEKGLEALLAVSRTYDPVFPPRMKAVLALQSHLAEHLADSAAVDNLRASLRTLLVGLTPPSDWRNAYQRTLDDAVGQLPMQPSSPQEAVEFLFDPLNSSLALLCRFLERMARSLADDPEGTGDAAALRRWCTGNVGQMPGITGADLTAIVRDVANEARTSWRHLLVRLGGDDPYEATAAWLYRDSCTTEAPASPDDLARLVLAEVPPDEERSTVLALLARLANEATIVEVMLPAARLDDKIETWTMSPDSVSGTELGRAFPLVVRPLARQADASDTWFDNWRSLLDIAEPDDLVWRPSPSDTAPDRPYACMAICHPAGDEYRRTLLETAWRQRIPAAIWHRGEGDVPGAMRGHAPRDLPHRVHALRGNPSGQGTGLALMWSNPYWVPDGWELKWRGPRT